MQDFTVIYDAGTPQNPITAMNLAAKWWEERADCSLDRNVEQHHALCWLGGKCAGHHLDHTAAQQLYCVHDLMSYSSLLWLLALVSVSSALLYIPTYRVGVSVCQSACQFIGNVYLCLLKPLWHL